MPDNIIRTTGRSKQYRFDRGGMPTEMGPYIGIVTNNIDPTRAGRLQVWIRQFGATAADGSPDLAQQSTWRTVSYIPPFYGSTPHTGTSQGVGTFTGNQQSYGLWFTPPDLGTEVICFFIEGDPNQGFYIGCVPNVKVGHMIPAIGASRRFDLSNEAQASYFQGVNQLPVTEINTENPAIANNPRFFDQSKPVHSVVAGIMVQQGLIRDTVRGPITSNSQRESPSSCYGMITPGKPVYQSGISDLEIKNRLERGTLTPEDIFVISRQGGHSIVMDDGNLEGQDNLVRIRTAKGHQITMSDDGDCFYIIHANGQTWLEFGKQGTVDVFSTNSVNIRTQGTINLHADRDINMFAGGAINMKATTFKAQADATLDLIGTGSMTLYSKNLIGIKSDGSLNLKNTTAGSWDAGAALNLKAACIKLNSGGGAPVLTPSNLRELSLADTRFVPDRGWQVEPGKLRTIVTRAPTHEPYPYHNQGVAAVTNLSDPPATNLLTSAARALASLAGVPVTSPLDAAAFLQQPTAELLVGSLDINQVTGLLAQTRLDVGQVFDVVSLDKGIGEYGLTAGQLETAGFLKPGTVQTFLQDPAQLETVLRSPTVWTGKSGVGGLTDLLVDPKLQSLTQNEIMVTALDGLRSAGVVTGQENPQQLASFVQTAAKFGVNNTVDWIQNAAPPDITNQINATAKSAQYAVDFVDTRATDLVTGSIQLGGFTGTTQRSQIDQAIAAIIGDPKVPIPNFGQGLYSGVPNSDLTYSGDDPIVRERINQERQRRGLPPLAQGGGVSI
jgi:hypothetical protein